MNLLPFVDAFPGGRAAFCEGVGTYGSDLSRWVNGVVQVPAAKCPVIERVSKGKVTCEELRPDIKWVRLADGKWPWHRKGRPAVDLTRQRAAA